MKQEITMACTDWAQRLAARHRNDLSFTERLALNDHLATCRACSEVYTTYNTIESRIRSLPAVKPLPAVSYRALQLQKDAVRPDKLMQFVSYLQDTLTTGIATLLSLYNNPIRLRLHQKLRICVGSLLVHLRQQTTYVWSYALRANGSTYHWGQNRINSRKNTLVSSCVTRGNGIIYMGSGIFYASAYDFCKKAVQA